jgi:3-hydroxyisobutyrate dehydrogenase-like beta-hydroxyacid dehydrogenase
MQFEWMRVWWLTISSLCGFRLGVSRSSTSSSTTTTRTSLKMSASIGFVGLGIMGEGMAARLISEGIAGSEEIPLVIWNRTGAKCTALVEKFPGKKIVIKDTAKEVVETCGITYSMLSTPEVCKVVFEGETGVLAGVSAGKSIIDCATLAESDMQRMSDAVVAKGG